MPKSTFYRISEEKRNRILDAARHEFLSVPYNEVSINRIIKEAEIPRGSFYQYFDDKEDLLYLVVQENKNNLFQILQEEIEKADGDIFESIERNIDRMVEVAYHDNSGKVQMLFSEPKVFEIMCNSIMNEKVCESDMSSRLLDKIDSSSLYVENEEELIQLVIILYGVLRDCMGRMFVYRNRLEEVVAKESIRARVGTLERHYRKKKD